MKTISRMGLLAALVVAAGACETLADQSPEALNFRMSGSNGTVIEALYSTEFIAGVTEEGVTEVRIFSSDTVLHTLPVDTTINIEANKQFFVQILPSAGTDTLDVSVNIEIDGRQVLNDTGFIFPLNPWRYVYQFNQLLTQSVEVIL